jgi:hypothetical protein
MYIIRAISIIVFICVLYYNSKNTLILQSVLLPVSINKISFLEDFLDDIYINDRDENTDSFSKLNIEETQDFLNSLDDNSNYLLHLEFIPNILTFHNDQPKLDLCKPFMINKNSSAELIKDFIIYKLDEMVDIFYLDDTILQDRKDCTGPIVSLTYFKFHTRT